MSENILKLPRLNQVPNYQPIYYSHYTIEVKLSKIRIGKKKKCDQDWARGIEINLFFGSSSSAGSIWTEISRVQIVLSNQLYISTLSGVVKHVYSKDRLFLS